MEKLHLDLLVTSGIPNAYKCSAEELSQLSGANLGNLVFRHALRFLVSDFEEYLPVNYPQAKKIASEREVGSVLVSCANWLGTREQDEKSNRVRADIVESINAPVISFGLGAQAPHGVEELKLGPESERLAKVLASKCHSLSVRDQLTAKTLRRVGIENVVVTGCPSNFLNLQHNLGAMIAERATRLAEQKPKWSSARICISEFSGGHLQSGAILRKSFAIMEKGPAFYLAQSPVLLPFLTGETDELPKEYLSNFSKSPEDLQSLLRSKALYFSSVDGWLDFARTCSFSVGMRIHGAMVPLQAGVPSLLIGHDSRTSGLAIEMGIPEMRPQEFLDTGVNDLPLLMAYVAEQMARYDTHRVKLAKNIKGYLTGNGIVPTDALCELVSD